VQSVAITSDGRYAISGCINDMVNLWDIKRKIFIRTFEEKSWCANSVAITPDGKYIVTGNGDRTVKLWDVNSGQKIRSFSGHSSAPRSVAITPNGRYIVSGSDTIKLWEIESGREIKTFEGHNSLVNSVAITPDGKHIVSGSQDGTIKIWNIERGKEIVQFVSFKDEGWIIAADGFYDCSNGMEKYLSFLDESKDMPKVLEETHPIYKEQKIKKLFTIEIKPIDILNASQTEIDHSTIHNNKIPIIDLNMDDLDKVFDSIKDEFEEKRSSRQKIDNSVYSSKLQEMQLPTFEKIRRFCGNLVDDNDADTLHIEMVQSGKMHKALIYDALEQFIERLDGQTITLIDWGCGQGIASLLVLDYFREKQLDIGIEKVILIDDTSSSLSRAMLHVKVLKQNDIDIEAIDATDPKSIEKLNKTRTDLSLNLFVNDAMPLDYLDIENDIFENAYFMCVSNESNEKIDEFFEGISDFIEIDKIITDRKAKVGKFLKFEKIFTLTNHSIPDIDINDDDIPF